MFSLISSRDHCQRSSPSWISQHVASRAWTCTEPEFRIIWMKLCSSDNHYSLVRDTLMTSEQWIFEQWRRRSPIADWIHLKNTIYNIQIYKCVLTEGQRVLVSVQNKHFYLLFSINKLNYSKAKKNEKSRDTVQQI